MFGSLALAAEEYKSPFPIWLPVVFVGLMAIAYSIRSAAGKSNDEGDAPVVKPRLDIADRKPSSLQAVPEADGVKVTWMKPPALEPKRIEETWIAVFEDNEEAGIFGFGVEPKNSTEYFINASDLTIGQVQAIQVYRVELTYFLEEGWGVDNGYGEPSITTFTWSTRS